MDLTRFEQRVVVGLLSHLSIADQRLHPAELDALEEITTALGLDPAAAADEAAVWFPDEATLLDAAEHVRPQARIFIRDLLKQLAMADGSIALEEDDLVRRIFGVWAGAPRLRRR